MVLDSSKIYDELRLIHPKFSYIVDSEHKINYVAPLQKDPHIFIIVNTMIDNKIKTTKFVEVSIYDEGVDLYFGRRYIVKFNEPRWQQKLRKVITFLAVNSDDFICDICGSYLKARKNKFGVFFLGCMNFPTCIGTKELNEIKY